MGRERRAGGRLARGARVPLLDGDDTDASIVIDGAGDLYVAAEYQRFGERKPEVGQLMKLDPRVRRPAWSIDAREIGFEGAGGSWSTPACTAISSSSRRRPGALAVERSGRRPWERQVGAPSIGSPVVVDGVLIQGDCAAICGRGTCRIPTPIPVLLWKLHFDDCIESTPAVWRGWTGTRQGYLYGVTEKTEAFP